MTIEWSPAAHIDPFDKGVLLVVLRYLLDQVVRSQLLLSISLIFRPDLCVKASVFGFSVFVKNCF